MHAEEPELSLEKELDVRKLLDGDLTVFEDSDEDGAWIAVESDHVVSIGT